jgi:hypothetical protein
MENRRIQHDVAWATALHILEVFSPLLREEEKRAAFHEIYERVKAGLLAYDRETKNLLHRLRPLEN